MSSNIHHVMFDTHAHHRRHSPTFYQCRYMFFIALILSFVHGNSWMLCSQLIIENIRWFWIRCHRIKKIKSDYQLSVLILLLLLIFYCVISNKKNCFDKNLFIWPNVLNLIKAAGDMFLTIIISKRNKLLSWESTNMC